MSVNPHGQRNPAAGEVSLQITDGDHEANAFWNLGYVTHEVPPRVLFAALPDAGCGVDGRPAHTGHCYIADLVDGNGDIVDDREITEELAQTLLDEPIEALRVRFRTWLWETEGATG